MRTIDERTVSLGSLAGILTLLGVAAGCSSAPAAGTDSTDWTSQAVVEDGLAQAYGIFKQNFTASNEDKTFHIGFGYHPALSSQKITIDQVRNVPVSGQAVLNFAAGTVTATLNGPLAGTQFASSQFDLYFVKNLVGSVKWERGDHYEFIGTFAPVPNGNPGQQSLTANIGTAAYGTDGVNLDFDMVVLALHGTVDPTANVLATGAKTIFEKRFFAEAANKILPTTTLTQSTTVETTDPLVRAGAQVFFNEKFSGNGRTCGTCHRVDDNLTIDATFVAGLPANDPLFSGIPAGLEDTTLVHQAIIRENVDGFDAPTTKFVERGVPHTLSMSTLLGEITTGLGQNDGPGAGIPGGSGFIPEAAPPDHKTGWSGDGAPGRGTLNEFAVGAVTQHFTTSLSRNPGVTFRIPTQDEVDALEAFQRFSGRQKNPNVGAMLFADPAAQSGMASALNEAACFACHRDLVGDSRVNFDGNTGIETLLTQSSRPRDGGFGTVNPGNVAGSVAGGFGDGQFNPPPLYEAADTPPFFHNSAISTIEAAVDFYRSPNFQASPAFNFVRPNLTNDSVQNIAAFLRTINALTNMAQVQKRVQYVQNNRGTGNTTILNLAIKDTQDAITVLSSPNLGGATSGSPTNKALAALQTVKQALQTAVVVPDDQRPFGYMTTPIAYLAAAKTDLLASNPNNEF
jgi:cytochrome c peroxidase